MMRQELIHAAVISGLFLLVFAAAEIWRALRAPAPEATRKLVHFSSGALCLSFSYLFHSHLTVLILCLLFVAIMAFTKRMGILRSVHGVDRKSQGTIYYPCAVYASFVLSSLFHQPLFYLIGILVLAISDSLAALVGGRYGFKIYVVETDKKSLEGSVFFFLATFLIVHLCLLLLTPMDRTMSVLCAVYCAILITAFESISLGGADNLFIPIGTIALLQRVHDKSPVQIIGRIAALFALFVIIYSLARRFKRFGITAVIGIALTGYSALMFGGISWLLPVVIGFILFTTLDIFLEHVPESDIVFRIRPIFYILLVSFGWTIVAGISSQFRVPVFVAFVTNITANLGILWQRRTRLRHHPYRITLPSWIRNANSFVRAVLLTIVFCVASLLTDRHLSPYFTLACVAAGTVIIELVYWTIECRRRGVWSDIRFLQCTAAVSAVVTALLSAVSMWFYHIDIRAILR